MKYRILALIAVLIIALILVVPVMAFTEPTQSTDNATDVILWPGTSVPVIIQGNLNVTFSDNLTVNNLEDSLTVAIETGAQVIADALVEFLESILAFLLAVLITILALTKGDPAGANNKSIFLYLMAVPVDLVFGFTYASTQTVGSGPWLEGVIVAIIGTALLLSVATSGLKEFMGRRKKG